MKTEFDYGMAFAAWGNAKELDGFSGPVSDLSVDIPEEDYVDMRRNGITNPSPKSYWKGFNSFFEDADSNQEDTMKEYYWTEDLKNMERSGMNHVSAALKIAGYDPEDDDGTFECNVCGETLDTGLMVACVRGEVPVLACINCMISEGLPAI